MSYRWDQKSGVWLLPGEESNEVVKARRVGQAPEDYDASSMTNCFWLNLFQDTLHELLESYLNGTKLGWKDRLLQRPMVRPHGKALALLRRARHLASDKLRAKNLDDGHEESLPLPTYIVRLYGILDQLSISAPSVGDEVKVHPDGDGRLADHLQLSKIEHLFRNTLGESDTVLLVQGSVGSGEQIGYSDLDLWMIVSQEELAEPAKLKQLAEATFRIQRHLLAFDPLQHHGVMLATEIDMRRYPESYLPLDAIAKSIYLYARHTNGLIARPRPSALGSALAFLNILTSLRGIVEKQREIQSAFSAKSILSCIMLMPALFEGAMGRPCFKADSFARVRKLVPQEQWSVMEDVSSIREQWQYQPSIVRRLIYTSIRNPFLLQYLMRHGLSGELERVCGCQLFHQWPERALALAEYLWGVICTSSTTSKNAI